MATVLELPYSDDITLSSGWAFLVSVERTGVGLRPPPIGFSAAIASPADVPFIEPTPGSTVALGEVTAVGGSGSNGASGVSGTSDTATGVVGSSQTGTGVLGYSATGIGVSAQSGSTSSPGLHAQAASMAATSSWMATCA
jgi:hypothetical protein